MAIFAHATEFAGSPPTSQAKSLLALSLMQMLFTIEKQLAIYRQRIEELFARHPDHDLFGSLPGAGPKISPRLLSEIGGDRQRFGAEAQALQCLGGTAPVTKRSGKGRRYWHVHRAGKSFGAAGRPHYTGRPINIVEHETDLERRNQLWARKLRNYEIQRKILRPLDVPGRKRHRKVSSPLRR